MIFRWRVAHYPSTCWFVSPMTLRTAVGGQAVAATGVASRRMLTGLGS